jgi:IclR family KDG regulon transcriptional repressor
VLLDSEVALLGRLHGRRSTPHSLHLGSRFPAHCSAMGKAMLAHDPVAADALIARGLTARTPRSITAPQRFRAELQHVRETGIATSDQEARPNLSCVAIPLRDQARRPVAALSISGPSRGFDGHRNTLMLRAVAAEAERLISPPRLSGGAPPSEPGRSPRGGVRDLPRVDDHRGGQPRGWSNCSSEAGR